MSVEKEFHKSNSPQMSDDVRDLMAALALAEEGFGASGLDGENKSQGWKYAKIGGLLDAVRDSLRKNKIRYIEYEVPAFIDGKHIKYLHSRVTHWPTGQWLETVQILESEKPGNQGKGAAITYMRKIAIRTLCMMSDKEEMDKDDDGQAEADHIEERKNDLISRPQVEWIENCLDNSPNGKKMLAAILDRLKIRSLNNIPADQYQNVSNYILKK